MTNRSKEAIRMKPDPEPRPGRVFKRIRRVLLVAVLAIGCAAGALFYLAKSEPAYYQSQQAFIDSTPPEQLEALAEEVEAGFEALANLNIQEAGGPGTSLDPGPALNQDDAPPAEATALKPEDVRIDTEKTVTLDNDQLAAVVHQRTDQWIKDRGYLMPDEIMDPVVAVDDGRLMMAFRLQSGPFSAVVSGQFTMDILDDGMAELMLERFYVGKLPVPAERLSEHLYDLTGDRRMEEAGRWLSKLSYMQIKPVLEVENRRRVRVTDYKVHDDELELTVRIQDHKTYKAMNAAIAGVAID